jgi:hypothetical protein
MDQLFPDLDIDHDTAEALALAAAVAEALEDERPSIPHAKVRDWLMELAAGNFDAKPPSA